MQVIITQRAKDEIKEIVKYISRDSIYYAEKTSEKIYNKIELLKTGIYTGRKVYELNDESTRELIYKNYRIIFQIQNEDVYVKRVIHSSRDFKRAYKSKF